MLTNAMKNTILEWFPGPDRIPNKKTKSNKNQIGWHLLDYLRMCSYRSYRVLVKELAGLNEQILMYQANLNQGVPAMQIRDEA